MQQYLNAIRTEIECEKMKDANDLIKWLNDENGNKKKRLEYVCRALFDALDTLKRINDLTK